jgi:hypothetical protein
MEGEGETIVRYTRLPAELRPVEIYPVDTLEPIDPDWVAITHAVSVREGRTDFSEGYCMYFLTDDGRMLAYEQFDTLEIALDQANAIAGIPQTAWRECHVELPEDQEDQDDICIPWSYVA